MICRFCRATAVNWTLREGMSTGSTHFMLAGNFCDHRRLPFEEKLCKQSSIVPTRIVFSLRINPTAWKKKPGLNQRRRANRFFLCWHDKLVSKNLSYVLESIFWVVLYPIGSRTWGLKCIRFFTVPFWWKMLKWSKNHESPSKGFLRGLVLLPSYIKAILQLGGHNTVRIKTNCQLRKSRQRSGKCPRVLLLFFSRRQNFFSGIILSGEGQVLQEQ